MQEYQSGAVRDTGGKGRMDLLPMCALIRVSKHMEDAIRPDPETGKAHYEERNWEMGIPMHTMIDSALRHIAKYMDGWDDEDHLCAATTNLLMALWTEEKRPEMQDIPSRIPRRSEEKKCSSYDDTFGVCNGTKDREVCCCKGDENNCDFYPEKRIIMAKLPPNYE